MPHVDVRGVSLEYLKKGEGDSIVLVHGVLGDLRVWRQQMEPFSQSHKVIAYSRRNHYPNPWTDYPADYTLPLERDDLLGLIRGLGIGPVHLVGNSLGGAIAALAALDSPVENSPAGEAARRLSLARLSASFVTAHQGAVPGKSEGNAI